MYYFGLSKNLKLPVQVVMSSWCQSCTSKNYAAATTQPLPKLFRCMLSNFTLFSGLVFCATLCVTIVTATGTCYQICINPRNLAEGHQRLARGKPPLRICASGEPMVKGSWATRWDLIWNAISQPPAATLDPHLVSSSANSLQDTLLSLDTLPVSTCVSTGHRPCACARPLLGAKERGGGLNNQ